ncbi:MAG: sodium/pantothenate symporter, partial [Aeromonas sp.]
GPGALASMICGISCYCVLSQLGIKLAGLHAIVPSLAAGLIAFIVVSLLTAPPSKEVRELFEHKA